MRKQKKTIENENAKTAKLVTQQYNTALMGATAVRH